MPLITWQSSRGELQTGRENEATDPSNKQLMVSRSPFYFLSSLPHRCEVCPVVFEKARQECAAGDMRWSLCTFSYVHALSTRA